MTDLDIIREAYDRVGIICRVRTEPGLSGQGEAAYLFLAGDREDRQRELREASLDFLCRNCPFMEFVDGALVSY